MKTNLNTMADQIKALYAIKTFKPPVTRSVVRDNGADDHNIWYKIENEAYEIRLGVVDNKLWQFSVYTPQQVVSDIFNLPNYINYILKKKDE